MKFSAKFAHVLVTVAALSGLVMAQRAPESPKPTGTTISREVQFFPVEDLRPGMKGTALSVFQGTEPEEFEVEIVMSVPKPERTPRGLNREERSSQVQAPTLGAVTSSVRRVPMTAGTGTRRLRPPLVRAAQEAGARWHALARRPTR